MSPEASEHVPTTVATGKLDGSGLRQAACGGCPWRGAIGPEDRAYRAATAHATSHGWRGPVQPVAERPQRHWLVTRTWEVDAASVNDALDAAAAGAHSTVNVREVLAGETVVRTTYTEREQ